MKILTYPSGNPLRLVSELAGIPDLAPIDVGDGRYEATFQIWADEDGQVHIQVPDDADEAAISDIFAAHDATPYAPPPTQAEKVDQLVDDGLAAIEAANITTTEGLKLATIFTQTLGGLRVIYGTGVPS